MNREEQVEKLTTYIAHFTDYIGKHLPDDVKAKISELAEAETNPLAKSIYETMNLNQRLASELNRPSCQDTGVLQFWVKCGTKFPLIDDLEVLLKEAVVRATVDAPLRHNSVETFDEYNTGKNVGKGTPTVFWDIVPNSDQCEIYVYMAGGGCTLPGKAMVLMPGAGYEGVAKFVLDVMTMSAPQRWKHFLKKVSMISVSDRREWAEKHLLWVLISRIPQDIHLPSV